MLKQAPAARSYFPILDPGQIAQAVIDGVVEGVFDFNGERHRLGSPPRWTKNPSSDIEWLILLHKFYYAPALGRNWQESGDSRYLQCWISLTESWIEQVPIDFLPSDVAGRRIPNWLSAWYYFEDAPLPPAFRAAFLDSLCEQADWLAAHLTPARNHRTLELLSLFMAGLALPELPNAKQWLLLAREEFVRNLETDLRPDGVHCEQSTDYHNIVLRNALIARRLAKMNCLDLGTAFDESLRRALDFAMWIHRPDGLIPSLSDGDTGSFLQELREGYELFGDERHLWVATQGREGRAPTQTQAEFPYGGYYIWRSGWGLRERFEDERFVVFDCGPLGDGNHGHLDCLSFELYGYGRPLIMDPGRYTYAEKTTPNWRALFRGTSYHNTVTVDGKQQARYEERNGKHKIRGPHAAFERIACASGLFHGRVVSPEYDAVHERELRVLDDRRFLITDRLQSPSEHRYDLWFHLSPHAHGWATVHGSSVTAPHIQIEQHTPAALAIEAGWISPMYGIKEPSPIVRYTAWGKDVTFVSEIEVHP